VAIELIKYLIAAIILVFLQFFLIQEINFGAWLKPMPYILFIFLLPFSYNRYLKLLAAFFIGLFLDILSNSGGLHAAACATLAFGRIMTDEKLIDADAIQLQGFHHVTPEYKNFRYYSLYVFSLTFLHHWVYFTLDYFTITAFLSVLATSLVSSVGTFLLMLLYKTIAKIQ
jgi:rod shape-determining protein MreD